MKFRRLFYTVQAIDLRQDLFQQAGAVQQFEGAACAAFGEHPRELVADALAADLVNLTGKGVDRGSGPLFDREIEAGGKAHGAQHAELVLFEALLRIADGADDMRAEIGAAAYKVKHRGLEITGFFPDLWIEQQAIDRKIAPDDIFLRAFREAYRFGAATVGVGSIIAEGGNLGDDLPAVDFVGDKNDAEVSSNSEGARKEL